MQLFLLFIMAVAGLLAGGAVASTNAGGSAQAARSVPPGTARYCVTGTRPEFADGFATLKRVLLAEMGDPVECTHVDEQTGDVLQPTTRGLAYYRTATNTPAFTNGFDRWALGIDGLVRWSGTALDPPPPANQGSNPALLGKSTAAKLPVPAPAPPVLSPPGSARAYLYERWPATARRMDCVILRESGWNPRARNASSDAAGLAQFIPSTWARTPQGRAGKSPYDPIAAVDAFGWMVARGGGSWEEWEVVLMGLCPASRF